MFQNEPQKYPFEGSKQSGGGNCWESGKRYPLSHALRSLSPSVPKSLCPLVSSITPSPKKMQVIEAIITSHRSSHLSVPRYQLQDMQPTSSYFYGHFPVPGLDGLDDRDDFCTVLTAVARMDIRMA